MQHSIIIPTWGAHSKELLARLCPSIMVHTNLSDLEVIVVANGCTDDTRQYVESLGYPFKLVWFDEGLGYAKAINEGVKVSEGRFLTFLNNDTMIQGSNWIDLLHGPFANAQVAVTGPMKTISPETNRLFLIFFCVMVKREVFEKIGGLDETFWSWGEDTHFCHQVEDQLGLKIEQVPIDANSVAELTRSKENSNIGVGNFPIWHEGGMSIRELGKEKGDQIINRNSALLKERYKQVDISKAQAINNFMGDGDLQWLAKEASSKQVVIEVGSWKGCSARAIGDNLSKDAVLYCVDTFNGSPAEEKNHFEAKQWDGDFVAYEFHKNNFDLIEQGKVLPFRMRSVNAAKLLLDKGIKADLIFIDAGHVYHEVQEDIKAWLPVLKDGGVMSGHDYKNQYWPGQIEVTPAVDDIFGASNVDNPKDTSIWVTKKETPESKAWIELQSRKPVVYDCFTFFNELDVLEIRFNELWDVVDRFVIVEASSTHQRQPKPFYFQENLQRFEKYLSKVSHLMIDFPAELNPDAGNGEEPGDAYWLLERHQRNRIMDILTRACIDDDIIIISDVDEIPRAETIKTYDIRAGIQALEMDFYYYNFNCRSDDSWREGKILPYKLLKNLSPCGARYKTCPDLRNAGWHLSYFGNTEHIAQKIKSFAHKEYNNDEVLAKVEERVNAGKDLFGRADQPFRTVPLQPNLPHYVIWNKQQFKDKGLIK